MIYRFLFADAIRNVTFVSRLPSAVHAVFFDSFQIAGYIDAFREGSDRFLAPPRIAGRDRNQIATFGVILDAQIISDVDAEKVSVEEFLEEILLIQFDVDEFDFLILRDRFIVEHLRQDGDLVFRVVVVVIVAEHHDR